MANFHESSLGHLYVYDEGLEQLPLIREIFAVVTALVGIITLSRFLLILNVKTSSTLRLTNLVKTSSGRIIVVYIISHLIHTVHYVDNICRPVNYFEPKWLYQKYLISEMELTFFVNFPIIFSGLYYMERLVSGINKENHADMVDACNKMAWYISGSLLTLGHYYTETAWRYEPFVNFTIGGEGFATILLAFIIFQLRKESLVKKNKIMGGIDLEQSAGLLDDEQGQKGYNITSSGIRARTPVKYF